MTVHAPIILKNYEEAVGVLHGLTLDGGSLLAEIGPCVIALPMELETELRTLLGERIGILRTDTTRAHRIRRGAR